MGQKQLQIKFNMKSKKAIPIYLLFVYYLFLSVIYLKQESITEGKVQSLMCYTLIWIILSIFSLLEITAVRDFLKKHYRWINGLMLVVSPVISFLMTELMVDNFNLDMFKAYSL